VAVSAEQRAGLWRAKLSALAREHFGRAEGDHHAAPWGAALDTDGAWTALIEQSPARSFGQALVLAAGHEASSLDLLVEHEVASVARRAALFDPAPSVWQVSGTTLEPAVAEPWEPEPAPMIEPHIADLLALDDVDVIVEHGQVTGECRGLEVARVTGSGVEQRLDVGVGAYDQGAFAAINPEMTPIESLVEVVAQVLTHRRRGALAHPLNRLARERWVRSELLGDPSQLGLRDLQVVEPIEPRSGVKDVAVASALGTSNEGDKVLVGCTVGIDLDAVPAAADLAERHDADRIVLVLPDRDRHPLVQAVADRSRRPIDFATAPEPWGSTESAAGRPHPA